MYIHFTSSSTRSQRGSNQSVNDIENKTNQTLKIEQTTNDERRRIMRARCEWQVLVSCVRCLFFLKAEYGPPSCETAIKLKHEHVEFHAMYND